MTGIDFNFGKRFTFSKHIPKDVSDFDRVFGVFKEFLTHTLQAISKKRFEGLNTLDKEYNIFKENYKLDSFEDALKSSGFIKEDIAPSADKS